MLERLGFGDHYYDDDVVDYNPGSEEEFDEDYEDEHQERVEHRADHPADDAETGLDAQFGRWGKVGRRRKGPFVPPDTRHHLAPVFVRPKK